MSHSRIEIMNHNFVLGFIEQSFFSDDGANLYFELVFAMDTSDIRKKKY